MQRTLLPEQRWEDGARQKKSTIINTNCNTRHQSGEGRHDSCLVVICVTVTFGEEAQEQEAEGGGGLNRGKKHLQLAAIRISGSHGSIFFFF